MVLSTGATAIVTARALGAGTIVLALAAVGKTARASSPLLGGPGSGSILRRGTLTANLRRSQELNGLVILLGVKDTDTLDIVPKLAEKCAGLRIFKDENDKLNLSAKDLGYSALVVSQFTLYGDTKKGFRPSFIKAARPPLAVDAYELFLAEMNKQGLKDVQHGEFGADMQVSLVNEGPCTIVIDTDEWHKGEK